MQVVRRRREKDGTTVRKLDNFPALLEALRDGDLVTAGLFCAPAIRIDRLQRFDAKREPRPPRRIDHSHEG
jgi:hypothetical protein